MIKPCQFCGKLPDILDHDAWNTRQESLTIGKHTLSKNMNGNLWIEFEDGEAMEITVEQLTKFYGEAF